MKGFLTTALAVTISGLKGLRWKPAILVLVLSLFGQAASQDFRNIPVTLHSLLTADYSADPFAIHFPDLNLSMLLDVLGDREPGEASNAYATLQGELLTPVATVTPLPGEITQNPPSATPTAHAISPSITASLPPTATPSPTPSLTPTGTGTPLTQPNSTAQPTLRATPMPTKIKSTQTRPTATQPSQGNPTPTPAPPTPTRKPPTATKAPTATQPPHPYPGPTKPPYP